MVNAVYVGKLENEKTCTFQAVPEVTTKDSGETLVFPGALCKILPVTTELEASPSLEADLPAFCEVRFKLIFALHHEIVPYALIIFKDYWESIQVFLGDVDQWLIDCTMGESFVKDTFPNTILAQNARRSDKTFSCCNGYEGTFCWIKHPDNSICCNCGESFKKT